MSRLLSVLGMGLVIVIQTAIAAILTRFFRLRLTTRVGTGIFIGGAIPFMLLLSTLVLTGILGLGVDLGDRETALFLLILVPFVIGITIDYVWMPAVQS